MSENVRIGDVRIDVSLVHNDLVCLVLEDDNRSLYQRVLWLVDEPINVDYAHRDYLQHFTRRIG